MFNRFNRDTLSLEDAEKLPRQNSLKNQKCYGLIAMVLTNKDVYSMTLTPQCLTLLSVGDSLDLKDAIRFALETNRRFKAQSLL